MRTMLQCHRRHCPPGLRRGGRRSLVCRGDPLAAEAMAADPAMLTRLLPFPVTVPTVNAASASNHPATLVVADFAP
jgi:hypothetical protein